MTQHHTPLPDPTATAPPGPDGAGDEPAASADEVTAYAPLPPVPVTPRHNGWTPVRQQLFLAMLAATGSVSAAAKAVGMSREGAYRLRARPGPEAAAFAEAWDLAATSRAFQRTNDLLQVALADVKARTVSRPMRRNGEVVGVRYEASAVGLFCLAMLRLEGLRRDRPSVRLDARVAKLRGDSTKV